MNEVLKAALIATGVLAGLAFLLASEAGIIGYLTMGWPLWGFIAGIGGTICTATFWIYMRTHHWK